MSTQHPLRRFSVPVLAAIVLILGLALPALATAIVQSERIPVTAGSTLTVACPAGETFVTGTASFFKSANTPRSFIDVAFSSTADDSGGQVTVPKGGKFATYIVECRPTTVTTTEVKQNTDTQFNRVRFTCPADYPYVHRVTTVLADRDGDFTTTDDQYQPAVFVQQEEVPNYFEAIAQQQGDYVQATYTCGVSPPPGT